MKQFACLSVPAWLYCHSAFSIAHVRCRQKKQVSPQLRPLFCILLAIELPLWPSVHWLVGQWCAGASNEMSERGPLVPLCQVEPFNGRERQGERLPGAWCLVVLPVSTGIEREAEPRFGPSRRRVTGRERAKLFITKRTTDLMVPTSADAASRQLAVPLLACSPKLNRRHS